MRSFAIIPAAGRSQRMGRPKLLLPWGDSTVIDHVIAAWSASNVTRTIVVVRPDDDALIRHCGDLEVEVVIPQVAPAEMKVSVGIALEHIRQNDAANDMDAWLLAPADSPRLSVHVVNRLLDEHDAKNPSILVPTINAQRGHPVLFPWILASEVERLADNEGVNALLDRHLVREIDCNDPAILDDLDTPDDYQRLRSTTS